MVTVDESKDSAPAAAAPETESSLREERRRTGRYVASAIAIFVCIYGLQQTLARGTPEYAAFFLPALIMFNYVLWILYASKSRKKIPDGMESAELLEEVKVGIENAPPEAAPSTSTAHPQPSTSPQKNIEHQFCRSYSVA